MKPSIHLYDEGTAPSLRSAEVARFLGDTLGCDADVRGEFVSFFHGDVEVMARDMARCRVRDPLSARSLEEPMYGEAEFERRRLAAGNRGAHGVLYEGFEVQAALRNLLPPEESGQRHAHVVFTNRLVVTWVQAERRYHLRTVICGAPALVSTSGLVEAPAKPREFHVALEAMGRVSSDDPAYLALRSRFRERILEHGDERLTDVARGYALQAALYALAGEGLCEDPACRLHDAHGQEDMLAAQRGEPGLCARHQRLVAELVAGWRA
jgi:hypothetical protein